MGCSASKLFDELKARFMKQPILTMVDTTKELHIESDASDFATGTVLSMKCDDDKWHPCAYLSKSLNDVKQTMIPMTRKCLES